jgi:hypothetical protein
VGGTVTLDGDTCEVEFTSAGSYSWTVPSGLTGLYAVLVGAGGGALADGASDGYAGSGGEVIYADLSGATGGASATIIVGAGGASDTDEAVDGGDSSLTLGSTVTAEGGVAGDFDGSSYCQGAGTFSIYVGNGSGASGAASASSADCAVGYVPGLSPASDADSDATPAFAIFAGATAEYGAGGRVLVAPGQSLDAPSALSGTGRGADVLVDSNDPITVSDSDEAGGSGRVMLRFTATDAGAGGAEPDGELAATGAETEGLLLGALTLLGLGALGVAAARARRSSEA